MNGKILECHCGNSCGIADTCNLGEQKRLSGGWEMVWDVSNGLGPVWLCPKHAKVARKLLKQLQMLFNEPLRHINFNPLMKK